RQRTETGPDTEEEQQGASVYIPGKVTEPDGLREETPDKVTGDTQDSGNHDLGYEEGETTENVTEEVARSIR
ncbi:hypothetical protein DV965_17125, partial [Staphylococcus pseudintermedius]|uniref:hypothetical protein n=1 Tax=Staphylococcus pseudintermedius TaxID=283734 RepID=UPI000E3615B8